jgi:hypothetical protein
MIREPELEFESELEQEFEGSGELDWEAAGSPKPITIPPIIICVGPPNHTLDRFQLDHAGPTPRISVMIDCIACQVVASWRTHRPIRAICLEGHTDNRGPAPYNDILGRRRAAEVEKRLRRAIDLLRPHLARRIRFTVSSAGATVPRASNATPAGQARNRRVEVYLRRSI